MKYKPHLRKVGNFWFAWRSKKFTVMNPIASARSLEACYNIAIDYLSVYTEPRRTPF